MDLASIKEELRDGPYAWPGGYPKYFIMGDTSEVSFEAVKANWKEVCRAHITRDHLNDWWVHLVDINWEDEFLRCAHTNEPIECAYPSTE